MSKKEYCKQKIIKILNSLARPNNEWVLLEKYNFCPTQRSLSYMLGITEKTLKSYLDELVQEGLIKIAIGEDDKPSGFWIKSNGMNFDLNPKTVNLLIHSCNDEVFDIYLQLWQKWNNNDFEIREDFKDDIIIALVNCKLIQVENNQLMWIR